MSDLGRFVGFLFGVVAVVAVVVGMVRFVVGMRKP